MSQTRRSAFAEKYGALLYKGELMKSILLAICIIAMCCALGCGSDNYLNMAPGAFGSCNSTTASQCYDFVGIGASNDGNCAAYGSTFSLSSSSCSTTDLVGSCTENTLTGIDVVRYYSDGGNPFTQATASAACAAASGTFQAG
jgi:hypothetical protein